MSILVVPVVCFVLELVFACALGRQLKRMQPPRWRPK